MSFPIDGFCNQRHHPGVGRQQHVLASAQPFGFGPAAKLTALAGHLAPLPVKFVGRGIALRYARLNDEPFVCVAERDLADTEEARALALDCAAAISVMEPYLVYACVRAGRPVHFFDSLFGFWQNERSLRELVRIAHVVRSACDAEAEEAFASLSVHEQMLLSHLIATTSYAQTLPGVADRVAELARLGVDTVRTTGPMLDLETLRIACDDGRGRATSTITRSARTLLVNLGGFNNAFLSYATRGSSITIMLRWLNGLAERTTDFDEIIVCSGAFTEQHARVVNGTRLRVGMVPHGELLELLLSHPVYLAPPGLTSLHEAVSLGVPVLLLPDQHYGHTHNRRQLAGTQLTRSGCTVSDLGLATDIPESDLDGTLALAEVAARIDSDPELFQRFSDYMDERLRAFRTMTASRGPDGFVGELVHLLHGQPISDVMSDIKNRMRNATASLAS